MFRVTSTGPTGLAPVREHRENLQVRVPAKVIDPFDGPIEAVPGETDPDADDEAPDHRERQDATLLRAERLERHGSLLEDREPEDLALLECVGQPRLLG